MILQLSDGSNDTHDIYYQDFISWAKEEYGKKVVEKLEEKGTKYDYSWKDYERQKNKT